MSKPVEKFRYLFLVLKLVLGIIGVFLYISSYFYGILLILAAGAIHFIYRGLSVDKETARIEIKRLLKNLYIPLIGVSVAILVGGILMIITGYNPIKAYAALFYGGFVKNWHVSILNAVPLIFTGLSIAFAFQAGLFNIGAEGQFYMGSMVAAFLGVYLDLPSVLSIVIIFLVAGILSAAYNYIPALLKVKTGAHEVITTMMFAHVARYISLIFIRNMGGRTAQKTADILESNWLLRIKEVLPSTNYRLHVGIFIAFGVAVFVYYILNYTKIGFEIRAVGHNKEAARTQGISVGKNIFIALLFAGFLAGLAGANEVLGLNHLMYENLSAGYGWNGISVALLASNHPIGVIFTALLWGALDAGGQYMSRTVQTPRSVVEIIKGIILFLIVAKYVYAYIGNRIRKKRKDKIEAGRE